MNQRPSAGHVSALRSITPRQDNDSQPHDLLVELKQAYLDAQAVDVVIDLNQVTDLDEAALEGLAFLYRDATERGGTVTVVRAPEPVVKAIQASGLDRLLNVV